MTFFCFPWMIALGEGTLPCRKARYPEGIMSTGFQTRPVPISWLPLGRVTSQQPVSVSLSAEGDDDNKAELPGGPRG